jgi:outer membrane protein OmpA-like peptidoglycan-associated protein
MFSLILLLFLFVGQEPYYIYHSENAYFKEAPAFILRAEVPSQTPKTISPIKISKPEPKREAKPLKIDIREVKLPQIQFKPLPPLKPEKEEKSTETVYFDFDSFELKPSEKEKLDSLPRDIQYKVTGYTCDIGEKDYNDRLALKRARAVREYLSSLVKEVSGKGNCCYIDLKDRWKNRRAEIKPLSK